MLRRNVQLSYSFLHRTLLVKGLAAPITMDSPPSLSADPDFSLSCRPGSGSEGSEPPVSLGDWSDSEKEPDSDGSSPGRSGKTSFLSVPSPNKNVAAQASEKKVAKVHLFWLSRCKAQPHRKLESVSCRAETPTERAREAGQSPGRRLQWQEAHKESVESQQEARGKEDTPEDIVQLIDEHGVYSSAKLVPTPEVALLSPYPPHLLEHGSREGEDFEIREVIVDEKPFQCAICAKAFKRAWELFSHEVVHNEERPFHCQLCQVWKQKWGCWDVVV